MKCELRISLTIDLGYRLRHRDELGLRDDGHYYGSYFNYAEFAEYAIPKLRNIGEKCKGYGYCVGVTINAYNYEIDGKFYYSTDLNLCIEKGTVNTYEAHETPAIARRKEYTSGWYEVGYKAYVADKKAKNEQERAVVDAIKTLISGLTEDSIRAVEDYCDNLNRERQNDYYEAKKMFIKNKIAEISGVQTEDD